MTEGAAPVSFILERFVREHHIWKQIWMPFLGEKLQVGIEEDNSATRQGSTFSLYKSNRVTCAQRTTDYIIDNFLITQAYFCESKVCKL